MSRGGDAYKIEPVRTGGRFDRRQFSARIDRHFPYKVTPGNVGYVGERGLTCALCVGTTVALRSLSGARKQASPAQTDETSTAADVGAPLVNPE